MKRRILAVLMSVVALFSFSLSFAACIEREEEEKVSVLADDAYIEDGCLIIKLTDGMEKNCGTAGADGKYTIVGVDNVADNYIDDDGYLIVKLTDGKQFNCGKVRSFWNGYNVGLSFTEIEVNGEVAGYCLTGLGDVETKNIAVPEVYKNKPVLEVASEAFRDTDILNIVIPDSVKSIGERAFYNCEQLNKVTLGAGLTEIGDSAFGKCESLEILNITDLGAWCAVSLGNMSANPMYFAQELYIDNEPATELVIPDTTEKISDFAFYECGNITSVDTGNGVKSIGANAFYNCEKLESVTVGNSVTYIGDSAFLSCTALENLVIGNSVEQIDAFAFSQCNSLTEIEIPSSVESLGECSFSECNNLERVNLNEGLKTLGDGAFCGCVSLAKFIMPNSVTQIGYGVLMFFAGDVGFGSVGDYSNNLKEIVISDNIKEITDFAFSKSNIELAIVGKKVATIRYSAFYGCGMLTSVVLPKSLTRIQSYAFYQCPYLNTIFYEGTEAAWDKIFIGANGNDELRKSTIYCYSEKQPEQEGNFWHYVDGVPTAWEISE